MSEVLARCARYRSGAQSSRLAEREKETRRSGPLTASTKPMPSILSSVSVTASSLGLKRTISGPRRPPGHPQEEGEHRPLKTLFSRGTIASWRLFVIYLHPPLFAIPATGFEGPAEPISFTFALIIVAEGNLEPLYIGPQWASEIVPGCPLNMAFDPPGPRGNPPIRDFLWEQEVVTPLA